MSNLKIGKMVLGGFQTNCYYIYQEDRRDEHGMCPAIVIDPAERGQYIFDALTRKGLCVSAILLTHGHVDHIAGAEELKQVSDAPIYASEKEADVLQDMQLNLSQMFGTPCMVHADVYAADGAEYKISDMSFQVISTPGHTEGGCAYYFKEANFLISGDTLFEGSVGRTDFPTGSMSVLIRSIKQKLFLLPDKTIVYPGHGGSTTIGWEKENNPFVI